MRLNGSAYVVAAAGIVVAFVVYQTWFNETRKVLRRLRDIEIALTAPPREADVPRFARIARLRRYLADDIRLKAGSASDITSREALMTIVAGWKPPEAGIEVHFIDVQIRVEDDKSAALALMTVVVDGVEERTGNPTQDTSAATVTLRKQEGEWVVAAAEAREVPVRRQSSHRRDHPAGVLALLQRDDHGLPDRLSAR